MTAAVPGSLAYGRVFPPQHDGDIGLGQSQKIGTVCNASAVPILRTLPGSSLSILSAVSSILRATTRTQRVRAARSDVARATKKKKGCHGSRMTAQGKIQDCNQERSGAPS